MEAPSFFKDVPQNCKQTRISEQDLVRLCRHIGKDWELIAVELGMKKTDREKAMNPASSQDLQMINVFTKWVQANPGEATRKNFIQAMWACNDTCTIDWDGIEDAFKDMK